jgi:hypothetical protein
MEEGGLQFSLGRIKNTTAGLKGRRGWFREEEDVHFLT